MPRADYWDEEDEWYSDRHIRGARYVRPSIQVVRDDNYGRRSELLPPEYTHSRTTGVHRARSVGPASAPNVTIYNTTRLDNESNPNVRTDQRNPSPLPSPRGRPLRVADDWRLEDEIADLRLEVARNRRSRSRSAHYHRDDSPPHVHRVHDPHHDAHLKDQWQLEIANQRLKEAEERMQREKQEELIKKRWELKHLKDQRERDEEEDRIKREEELMQKRLELKLLKTQRERDEEEERIKREEDRLKKEWELKKEQEERKRLQRAKEAEEEKRRIILEEQQKAAKKAEEEEEERKRIVMEEELKRTKRQKEEEERTRRIIQENQLKQEREKREAEAARQAAVDAFNKKRAEEEKKAEELEKRVIAEYERKKVLDAEKAKKEKEEFLLKIRLEEEKRKKEEEEEYQRFLEKQRQKEAKEKAEKEAKEKELEEEMRKRLAKCGFQDNQIQAMLQADEQPPQHHHLQQGLMPYNPLPPQQRQPTFVKVHKDHLAIETLLFYDIPYEFDRTDPNYIIILREMDSRETEILFEHTRRARTRSSRLLVEERTDQGKPEYAWVRRRNKSRSPSMSRRRSSPKRVVGIKEMFF